MSVTVVTVLTIAGICCIFVVTTLLALLRVAAHSDAQRDRDGEAEQGLLAMREQTVVELPPTGRFDRRQERRLDSGDRPLVR